MKQSKSITLLGVAFLSTGVARVEPDNPNVFTFRPRIVSANVIRRN
jgi:hypothetical protein